MEPLSPSESSAKTVKLDVKLEVSLDPLEWIHSDVHELLFQHFKGEDSLRASLVSQSWSERTEKSLKCWKDLELNINRYNSKKINRPIAEDLKSSRKYQKLILDRIDDVSGLISVLRDRKWKSVKMDCLIDQESVQLKEILKIVEPTVETLCVQHMFNVKFRSSPSNSEVSTILKYPNLKDLKFYDCFDLLMEDATGDCKKLEKLKLHINTSADINDDSLLSKLLNKVLDNNAKLEKFSLGASTYGPRLKIFPIMTLNHQFKLKSLSLNYWPDGDRIVNFLKSQSNNLEKLKLNPCTSLETIKTILKMPKLTKVKLKLPDEIFADWDNVHFNENSTIKDFDLEFGYWLYDYLEVPDKLLQPIPNCQQMKLEGLGSTVLRSLAQHCPRIKELKIEYLDVQHIDELADLPAIEAFECRTVIKGLLLRQIRAKPDEARTRLEKLILQQASDSDFDSDEDENLDFDEA